MSSKLALDHEGAVSTSYMELLEQKYVVGGQIFVAETPMEIITVLGSCVAVCLWDRKTKRGGMNHYLMPSAKAADSSNGGRSATQLLIASMLCRGSEIENLEAKVFGGGNRFFTSKFLLVGHQNVEIAKQVLEEACVPIVSEDTGGELGRKICFNTQTGNVKVIPVVYSN